MSTKSDEQTRQQIRVRYAAAATAVSAGQGCGCGTSSGSAAGGCCSTGESGGCCSDVSGASPIEVEEGFGAGPYSDEEHTQVPAEALAASLGCGNPLVVADLHAGETVLDLCSGGGIDVLLAARRVGPSGFVYGVDMTDEMLELARANAQKAGATNVDFVKGSIEDIPLPDASVDVIISNCVINLSVDRPAVIAEMFRLLRAGGRIGISDVVAEDDINPEQRAERGSYVGCIAGALSRSEYLDGLTAAGFADATVTFSHEAADGMYAAIIHATKPTHERDR